MSEGIHGGVLLEGWCSLLLDGFVAGGMREVVVSPGSRSTPVVLAAASHPELELTVIVDERSAAFFALGRARATGRPSLLVRTSGTAGSHDLPAVIEAAEAKIPLLVLTADRPPELVGVRAPQTIDQTRLFGTYARCLELGVPDSAPLPLASVRRAGVQAAALAMDGAPVQVNLRARKPLEPPSELSAEDEAFLSEVSALRGSPGPRIHPPAPAVPSAEGLAALKNAIARSRRPLVVAGPAVAYRPEDRTALVEWAAGLGAPLCLEATSQLRLGPGGLGAPGFDAALRVPKIRAGLAPDLILQLGNPPIGTGLEGLAGPRICLAPGGFPDPQSRAEVVQGSLPSFARALPGSRFRPEPGWVERWAELFSAVSSLPLPDWSEAHVTRAARSAVPEGGFLMVGNSLPVRHLDQFVPSGGPACTVLHQRGASGIDGLIAGAVGAARSRPTVLLIGDVSARHDLGSLALGPLAPDLTVVVIHNGGGRIFEQLPIARRLGLDHPGLEPFTTPDPISLVPVAAALGWRAVAAADRFEFEEAVGRPADGRPRFIEARVPPHEATETLGEWVATLGRF